MNVQLSHGLGRDKPAPATLIPVEKKENEMKKIYTAKEHGFFNHLAAFLAAYSSISQGVLAQHHGSVLRYRVGEKIGFGGGGAAEVALAFEPRALMDLLVSDGWPTTIEFEVHVPEHGKQLEDLPQVPKEHVLSGIGGVVGIIITAQFVSYFEEYRPIVEATYGDQPQNWPPAWNFGRVVRNAFSHGGKIDIRNANATPVTWRGISYDYNSNCLELLFNDLGIVEIIYLLEDLDISLPK